MEQERIQKIRFRWSLVTFGTIVLFWTIYRFTVGAVPTTPSSIFIDKDVSWDLPFSISRWWDVVFGPLGAASLVSIICSLDALFEDSEKESEQGSLIFGLVIGLITLILPLIGLFLIVTLALFAGMFCCLYLTPDELPAVLCYVLGLSLTFVLGFSLTYGFVYSLTYGLIYGLLFFPSFIDKAWSWLLAR
jgi:hypothetical protein